MTLVKSPDLKNHTIALISKDGQLLMPLSGEPMGNVTQYLQKLGIGIYDAENQPEVLEKNNLNLGTRVLAHTATGNKMWLM